MDWILPPAHREVINGIQHFAVENVRSARRFLKRAGLDTPIDDLEFYLLNKHSQPEDIRSMTQVLKSGGALGLLSEAGLPCVADPGSSLVAEVHKMGKPVVPMIGPSSIFLALMASGFNGQQFAFSGYVPKDGSDRTRWIKQAYSRARQQGETQIFMDTPFRNDKLLGDLISALPGEAMVCIAADLTTSNEMVKTAPISSWKKRKPSLNKRPALFLLGYQSGQG